jgi:hypothetical protein
MREVQRDVAASLSFGLIVEARLNNFPHNFVVLPKLTRKPLDQGRSLAAKVVNFTKRHVTDRVFSLLWDQCVLYFVCPVKRVIVCCGPKGKGYKLSVPTALLRTIAPALKWGFLLLKIALATQGLGSAVPDISEFISDVGAVNSLMEELTSHLEDAALSTVEDYEAALSSCLDDAAVPSSVNEVFRLVYKAEQGTQQTFSQWTPQNTGLKQAIHGRDGSAWVSEEAVDEYERR